MAGVDGATIHLEGDVLLEEGVGLEDREAVVRRVEAIVDQIAEQCQAMVAGKPSKQPPHAKLLQQVQKLDAAAGTKKMWDLSCRALKRAYDLLVATGVHLAEDRSCTVLEGFKVDPNLLVVACRLLNKVHEGDVEDEMWGLADNLMNVILTIIGHSVSVKRAAYERKEGGPMNLNHELMLLRYLCSFAIDEDVEAVLRDVLATLHYQNEATEFVSDGTKEGFSEYLEHLDSRWKYRRLLEARAESPHTKLYGNAGQSIINAKIKSKCFVDFDEHGLPFTNDVTPQHPWADLNDYRRQFLNAYSTVRARFPEMDSQAYAKFDNRKMVVAEQLQILRRASVAELLRKLVNKDLDYGESQDTQSTEVGMYTGETDELYIRCVTRSLDGDFEQSRVPLPVLYEPMYLLLRTEMKAFGKMFFEKYGDKYKILPSRVKGLESTLLKMLKEKKTTIGSITDLVGFTILTDTEEEAEQVYAEIKAMMVPGDIKEALTWQNPTRRGYRSQDITGVPQGFNTRIQVQCRTKKLDALNAGQYSNHDAYKVFSGRELLKQINANPGEYLDLLYQAVHNMCVAYHGASAGVMDLYSRDYHDGMSIVRTGKLY